MMRYAITGATGKLGHGILTELMTLVAAKDIIAIVRNVEKAQTILPAGIEIRQGDYTQASAMTTALIGVDCLLFVSSQPGGAVSREQQHLNVVQAAKNAGIQWIGYTSFPDANHATTPLALDHQATEAAILDAGLAHSFLRNNWYLENELGLINAGLQGQPFVYAGGDGQVGWTLEADYAKAAAHVLVTAQPKDIYEFSGEGHTYAELAAVVAELSPKTFTVEALDLATYQQQLTAQGLDEQTVAIMGMLQKLIRDNQLANTTDDLATVLGRPAPSLKALVQTVIKEQN